MQKKCLREAQQNMRKIRHDALNKGITIAKSEYEEVGVTYR